MGHRKRGWGETLLGAIGEILEEILDALFD